MRDVDEVRRDIDEVREYYDPNETDPQRRWIGLGLLMEARGRAECTTGRVIADSGGEIP